jgi:hypothetical protein
MRRQWLIIVLLAVALGLTLTILAARFEPYCPVCNFILFPGAVITDRWLHVDFWQPGPAFALSCFAFDTLIYGGIIWLLWPIQRKPH